MRCGDTPAAHLVRPGTEPGTGTLVRLECLQPVQSAQGPTVVDVYTPCVPPGDTTCEANGQPPSAPGSRCARALTCDTTLREWQVPCGSDADCAGAGLGAFRCDTGRAAGAICVNPTCG